MLRELRIRNFAVIETVLVSFGPGLNVLTGETGAGKSILIDAILLLRGGRAQTDVIRADVFRFLATPAGDPFDLIYIAPPQYAGLWLRALQAIDAAPAWLAPRGLAIAQMHPKEWSPPQLGNLAVTDERRYGSTVLAFFERS